MGVYLDPEELIQLESKAKQRSTSASALIAGFVREAINEEQALSGSGVDRIENLLLALTNRITKIERIQRTLVLNTAYARGYVIGSARTAPAESRKSIEQEMVKTYEKQREFFFEVYPEQREGETSEARP